MSGDFCVDDGVKWPEVTHRQVSPVEGMDDKGLIAEVDDTRNLQDDHWLGSSWACFHLDNHQGGTNCG